MENYDKLKRVIQEANPKKIWEFPHIGEKTRQPIRLADVLMAMNKNKSSEETTHLISIWGRIMDTHFNTKGYWDLKDNNLDNQSEETKQFLINLLVKQL